MKSTAIGFFLIALFTPYDLLATTRIVPCNQEAIQYAIEVSQSGDSVIVQAGICTGPFSPALAKIDGKTDLVLMSEAGREATHLCTEAGGYHVVQIINSANIKIIGFTMKYYGGALISCIFSSNSQGIEIIECTLIDSPAGVGSDGSEMKISSCDIYNNFWGISIGPNSFIQVFNNTIHSNYMGITLSGDGGDIINATIISNRMHGNISAAIHGERSASGALVISHNLLNDNLDDGIRLSAPMDIVISDNTIVSNMKAGLNLLAGTALLIRNNIIAMNKYAGIVAHYGSNPIINCNDVWGNANFANGNYVGYITDQTGYNGNISVDPFFCNASGGDYSLAANSLALLASCGAMGAITTPGCSNQTPIEQVTWGAIKALYR